MSILGRLNSAQCSKLCSLQTTAECVSGTWITDRRMSTIFKLRTEFKSESYLWKINCMFNFQLTLTVIPTCFKKVVRADAIAELVKKKKTLYM